MPRASAVTAGSLKETRRWSCKVSIGQRAPRAEDVRQAPCAWARSVGAGAFSSLYGMLGDSWSGRSAALSGRLGASPPWGL